MKTQLRDLRSKLARRLRERPFHPPFKKEEPWRRHHGQRDRWCDIRDLPMSEHIEMIAMNAIMMDRQLSKARKMVSEMMESKAFKRKTIGEIGALLAVESSCYGKIEATFKVDESGSSVVDIVYPNGETKTYIVIQQVIGNCHDDQSRSLEASEQHGIRKEV